MKNMHPLPLGLADEINFGEQRATIQEIIDEYPEYIEQALDEVGLFTLDDDAMQELAQAVRSHHWMLITVAELRNWAGNGRLLVCHQKE